MKLYFYFLDRPYMGKPKLRLEECEVIEKPKTYIPVDKFPDGFYGRYVKKENTDHFSENGMLFVTDTRDDDFAKTAFKNYWGIKVHELKSRIGKIEEYFECIERFGENE